jgi:hypothetical protein
MDSKGARLAIRAYNETVTFLGVLAQGLTILGVPTTVTTKFGFVLRVSLASGVTIVPGVALNDFYIEVRSCTSDASCGFGLKCVGDIICTTPLARGIPCFDHSQW